MTVNRKNKKTDNYYQLFKISLIEIFFTKFYKISFLRMIKCKQNISYKLYFWYRLDRLLKNVNMLLVDISKR
jgi:hypothetical protein